MTNFTERLQKNNFASDLIIDNKSKDCVIIFHAFNATPYEMHVVADAIGTLGVDVYVPLIPKHGISSSELAELNLDEAVEWSKLYIQDKRKKYNRIIIIGHSLGSGLVYSIASSDIPIEGVILTGLSKNFTQRIRLLTWLTKIFKIKYIPTNFGHLEKSKVVSREYLNWKRKKLPKQPVQLMREMVETVPNRYDSLSSISTPFMLVIGTKDFITHADYVDNFLLTTKSLRKIAFILNKGSHEIFLDDFKNIVISKILNFVIEILADKTIKEENLIECFVLDEDKEINKTNDLREIINKNKSIVALHSKVCYP
ncbi:MAG: alpha/beta hydrolase [Candidatus Heimdallarchaeota archaeon]|nr:alpha/beta hydrolase [Candidatus Heimdallarchaeota archaeon]MBY8993595.1 alpha/beta hydrolase [Candidatus Heimdallarchaeota archaeon]